jgi:hypothetical protein
MSNDDKKKTHVRPPPVPILEQGKPKTGPKKDVFRIGGDPKKLP